MEIYQEPIHYQNQALCMKVWEFTSKAAVPVAPVQSLRWHYHKEIEFIYVRSGIHEMRTPDRVYDLHPGDVIVIGSSRLHCGRRLGGDDLVYIVLHVDLHTHFDPPTMMYYPHFSEVRHPLETLNDLFRERKDVREEVGGIIVRLHEEITAQDKGYEIAASMLIKQLLLALLRGDTRGVLEARDIAGSTVIQPILEHIDRHLGDRIDMHEASRLANMSYAYFSKFFKKMTGLPFVDYVNRKRIAKAEQLLVTTRDSVTEIASAVGIGNMAHFYELFRRYNRCTPKQYLHKMEVARDV